MSGTTGTASTVVALSPAEEKKADKDRLLTALINVCGVPYARYKDHPIVLVSGPVVRPTDETPTPCFTNGYLRIQHDRGRCNGIGMISSRSLNKSSLFRYFMLCVV